MGTVWNIIRQGCQRWASLVRWIDTADHRISPTQGVSQLDIFLNSGWVAHFLGGFIRVHVYHDYYGDSEGEGLYREGIAALPNPPRRMVHSQ